MDLPRYSDRDVPEYESMKEAGRIAAETHEYLRSLLEAGRTTGELDEAAEQRIRETGAVPAFRDLKDTNYAITVSINDDLIHTPPKPDKTIKNGDVVSIDLGAKYDGHYSDTAVTYVVGDSGSSEHEELVEQTKTALYAGILEATAGKTLKDVGEAIEENTGSFGNVTAWAGHFIGRELHLGPQVHNRAAKNEPLQLETGMFLAIEPILTLNPGVKALQRSGSKAIRARDGAPGAHFEHTIRVRKERAEILTARSDEPERL